MNKESMNIQHHKKKIIVGICGTPGTGKTSLCNLLKKDGYYIIYLFDFLKEKKLLKKYDNNKKCYIININKIILKIKKYIYTIKEDIIIIDHHLSYLFSDYSIILRTRPDILEKRLLNRKYSYKKVIENKNAEALDVILCNAFQKYKNINKIFEIDTSNDTKYTIEKRCIFILNYCIQFKNNKYMKINQYKPGSINWINYDN